MGQTSFQYKGMTVNVSWEGKPSREAVRCAARVLVDAVEEWVREENQARTKEQALAG